MQKQLVSAFSLVCLMALPAINVGCSEAQKQQWNDFIGGRSRQNRTVQSTPERGASKRDETRMASAQAPAQDAPAGNDATETGGAVTGSESADDVDNDVEAYAARMRPVKETDYQPNDHTSKIHRQQDPQRTRRIHDAAAQSDGAGEPPAEGTRDNAMVRHEENAHATPKASEEASPVTENESASEESIVRTASSRDEPANKSTAKSNNPKPASPDRVETISDEAKPMVAANSAPATIENAALPEEPHEPTEQTGLPELIDVTVTAAPEPLPEPASNTDEPQTGTMSANSSAANATTEASLVARIAELEKRVATDPNNLEEQYRLRMLYLIDGQDGKAKEVIPGVDADLQGIITAQIESLILARSTSGRDPATWATRQLESIEELRRLIKERADLVVARVVLCTEVSGYGRYKPVEPAEFKAGRRNQVLIYTEIDNFASKRTNSGMYRTLLSTRQTLLTTDGKELWSEHSENIEDLSRRPLRDFYLCSLPITIPKTLPPGDYIYKVEVEDVLAGKINSNTTSFKIVP